MKVILIQDVYKHGVAGEVVDVADGFARNYLIPKRLASKATPGALKQAEGLRASSAARKAALEGRLNDLGRQIDGVELIFGRRASPTGKLFGSVTTTEVADALNAKTGIDINRRRISQSLPREIGTHDIPVRLGTDISPMLKVTIVREEELPRYLQQRADAERTSKEQAENAALDAATNPNVMVESETASVTQSEAATPETAETAAE